MTPAPDLTGQRPKTRSSQWLSLHIFYNDRQDDLIELAIGPLIRELTEDSLIESAFFLRHWESGPHVRLRLRCIPGRSEEVSRRARHRIDDWLKRNPSPDVDPERLEVSMRRLSELEHGSVRAFPPAPNNSAQVITYVPELDKYGGLAGVAVAERFFGGSSQIALEVIAATRHNGRARLGQGFLLMLIAVSAFRLNEAEAEAFARSYHSYWVRYVASGKAREQEAWERQFQLQRDVLTEIAASALAGGAVGGAIGSRWRRLFGDAYADLVPLIRDGVVRLPMFPGSAERPVLDSLLANYLHTSNNRLDVRPQAEAYLALLVMRAIQSVRSRHE